MRLSSLRVSTAPRVALTALAAVAALLLAACGGSSNSALDDTDATTGVDGRPIPTATPYARVPEPIIVSGSAAGAPSSSQVTYVVEAGDTLSGIAERFDSSVEDIMADNAITDATLIFVGQALLIPSGSALVANTPEPPVPAADDADAPPAEDGAAGSNGGSEYEVQPGDTALAVAFRFDVTIDELAAANGTTPDGLNNLQVGDILVIP